MIDNSKEYILCAAIKRKTQRRLMYVERFQGRFWKWLCVMLHSFLYKGVIVNPYNEGTNDIMSIEIGYRHHDIFQRFPNKLESAEQGFYTSRGRFVDRYDGMRIARECGQVSYDVAYEKPTSLEYTADAEGRELIMKHPINPLFSEDLY